MATQLSPHFTLEELTTSSHHEIPNTVPPELLPEIARLAQFLETIREIIGPLHVNSAYRCVELNTAVGGAASSQHTKAQAADLTPLNGTKKEMVAKLLASNLPIDQIIAEYWGQGGGGWVHVSMAPIGRAARGSKLMISKGTGYLPLDLAALPS